MNFIAILAAAIILQLSPGLSEPVGGDGARVDAAVLVSTNATATSNVAAVYDLPVFGNVQTVVTNYTDVLTFTTNNVLGVTSYKPVTNALFALTASGGFAETNAIDRCLAPGARLLLTGAPVTIFLR